MRHCWLTLLAMFQKYFAASEVLRGIQCADGKRVELAAEGIDVSEGQRTSVSAICQQNEDSFLMRIYPAAGARKAGVAVTVRWQSRARG